jgi:hypothetical protein
MLTMSLMDDCNALLAAELEYAEYTARRTSMANPDEGIVRIRSGGIPCLLDRGRPTIPYCIDTFRCYVGYTATGEAAGWATLYVSRDFGY